MAFGTKTLVSFRLSDTTRDNLQELVEVQRKIDEYEPKFSWAKRDRTEMLAMSVDYLLGEKKKELAAIHLKIDVEAKTIKKLPSNGTRGKKAVANKRINSASQITSERAVGAVCRPPSVEEASKLTVEEPLFAREVPVNYYGYRVCYETHRGERRECHYKGNRAACERKAMLRPLASKVLEVEGFTEEQYVRVFGRGKM